MNYLEFEGKSTEEAIKNACSHFQVPPEQLKLEILSVGSPGLFGLGGRKAKIQAALREESQDSLLPQAQEILEQLLQRLDASGKVSGRQEDGGIILNIETEDAGLLIGKQGQTLEALQYLLTKILAQKGRRKVRVTIDVESYRARHDEALVQLAIKNGEKVKRSGKSITLNPMNPYDRRIVHLTLQSDKELETMSRGEGLYKKVIIYPVSGQKERWPRGTL